MRKLSWNVCLKRNCNGRISATFKIKYKKTTCKVKVPDIYDVYKAVDDDTFDERFIDELKTAFGKKVGKKIFNQIMDDFAEL